IPTDHRDWRDRPALSHIPAHGPIRRVVELEARREFTAGRKLEFVRICCCPGMLIDVELASFFRAQLLWTRGGQIGWPQVDGGSASDHRKEQRCAQRERANAIAAPLTLRDRTHGLVRHRILPSTICRQRCPSWTS